MTKRFTMSKQNKTTHHTTGNQTRYQRQSRIEESSCSRSNQIKRTDPSQVSCRLYNSPSEIEDLSSRLDEVCLRGSRAENTNSFSNTAKWGRQRLHQTKSKKTNPEVTRPEEKQKTFYSKVFSNSRIQDPTADHPKTSSRGSFEGSARQKRWERYITFLKNGSKTESQRRIQEKRARREEQRILRQKFLDRVKFQASQSSRTEQPSRDEPDTTSRDQSDRDFYPEPRSGRDAATIRRLTANFLPSLSDNGSLVERQNTQAIKSDDSSRQLVEVCLEVSYSEKGATLFSTMDEKALLPMFSDQPIEEGEIQNLNSISSIRNKVGQIILFHRRREDFGLNNLVMFEDEFQRIRNIFRTKLSCKDLTVSNFKRKPTQHPVQIFIHALLFVVSEKRKRILRLEQSLQTGRQEKGREEILNLKTQSQGLYCPIGELQEPIAQK